VTAETYARELRLSKDIQQDAQEMVRRAEYALGKSIRKGQADGTVAKVGTIGGSLPGATRGHLHKITSRATDFASKSELYGQRGEDGVLAIADNAEPEQFETALTEARTEGNLSRANVVRKVKGKGRASPNKTRAEKADLLEDLARQGFSSRQMCKALGLEPGDQRMVGVVRMFGLAGRRCLPTRGQTDRYSSVVWVEREAVGCPASTSSRTVMARPYRMVAVRFPPALAVWSSPA